MLLARKPRPCALAIAASLGALCFATATVPASAALAGADQLPPTSTTTTTVVPGLVVTMSFEIPLNTTSAGLPTGTAVKATVVVTNPASVSFTNVPMVLRFGQKPDQIVSVDDGTGKVGVIDGMTGAWFHTIASIPATSVTTYTVTYAKLCTGRWAFAARVADKAASQFVQWAGQTDPRCVGDESINPQPVSFYQLTWPPSASTNSTSTTTTTTSSVPIGGSVSGATTTTLATASTTTALKPAVAVVAPTTTVAGARPVAPSTTAVSLERTTTTTAGSTTTTRVPAPSSSSAKPDFAAGRPTTTLLYCRTIGGTRSCGPKAATFTPKKPLNSKPVAKPKKKK